MQSIIEKYEAILNKPQPEPFKGYIEELLAALKGNETTVEILNKKSVEVDFKMPYVKTKGKVSGMAASRLADNAELGIDNSVAGEFIKGNVG